MINRVVLVGRITKDLELKKTQNGTSVVSFTCAVNRRFQQEQAADFINCVAWNKTAEFISQYGRKGSLVGLEGRIQTRNYEDATGRRVYVTEVVCDSIQLLESKSVNESRAVNSDFGNELPENDFEDMKVESLDISSDDLPF